MHGADGSARRDNQCCSEIGDDRDNVRVRYMWLFISVWSTATWLEVENFLKTTSLIAQTTSRSAPARASGTTCLRSQLYGRSLEETIPIGKPNRGAAGHGG